MTVGDGTILSLFEVTVHALLKNVQTAVGRGLAPTEVCDLNHKNGGSKPPPYHT